MGPEVKKEKGLSPEELDEVEEVKRWNQQEIKKKERREKLKEDILLNEGVLVKIGEKEYRVKARSYKHLKTIKKAVLELFDFSDITEIYSEIQKQTTDKRGELAGEFFKKVNERVNRKLDDLIRITILILKDEPDKKITKKEIEYFERHCGPATSELIFEEFIYMNGGGGLLKNLLSLREIV